MLNDFIKIRGARVHNLKNISLDIPKNKLVVISGVSGSGKSSLAFDTLYAEGQRRYVESLSSYARQFLGVQQKPDADKIEGISPAIAIDQRKSSHNPRSTVGTTTEIYDYLRLLFARVGKPHCPKCGKLVARQSVQQITDQVLKLPKGQEFMILGPILRAKKGEHKGLLEEVKRAGFSRLRIDGLVYNIEEAVDKDLDKNKKHSIEVVVDRLKAEKDIDKPRLSDSIETALKLGKGLVIISYPSSSNKLSHSATQSLNHLFSEHFACEECGVSLPEIEPRLFSFNSPYGACPSCTGLGEKLEIDPALVMPNPNLTIAEGAIFPWARASHKLGRQGYYWHLLQDLAVRRAFSLDTPVKNLSQEILNFILRGEGDEGPYEGVINSLQRRYRETDSDYARKEIEQYMVEKQCEVCQGQRLKPEVLSVLIGGLSIAQATARPIAQGKEFFDELAKNQDNKFFSGEEEKIAKNIIKEIVSRLGFMLDVGLEYLTLDRKVATLAGGEEQRIRLATQIGSGLTGVLYILDEPSIGLHSRDQARLVETLKKLRDLGNSVLVVEHDQQTIMAADWVIEIGPGAGKNGGKVVFEGTPKELLKANTLTGEYLSGRRKVQCDDKQISNFQFSISKQITNTKSQIPNFLTIKGAREHNLKNIDVKIPLGQFVCVTGVSGSGKSTLINDILARALLKKFYGAKEEPGKFAAILGLEHLKKAALVDQSPIGRTPRSNPATYIGVFNYIRDLFANLRESRVRGYKPGRFSFNVKGGRCEQCEGQGVKRVEMYFLPDVFVECQSCSGARYNKEVLEIDYNGKNIAEVLSMTIEEALDFFKNIPIAVQKLKTLCEVGLGYIELGQSAISLSGGEAQRVKLAKELSKSNSGRTIYILDEPTTGLHPDDIKRLILVLKKLVAKGNTVLIIEHEIHIIHNADWIIDLGPEGGDNGGYVITEGTPDEIAKSRKSYTGEFLKKRFFR